MEVNFETPSEAMPLLISHLLNKGHHIKPRGFGCYELDNVQINIARPWMIPLSVPGRRLNQFIGAVEAAQLVGQTSIPELVTDRVKAFHKFTDRGVFHGAYGARISGRLDDLAKLLRKDRDTRQAVLTIYDSDVDLNANKRDVPCTIAIQFLLRRGQLNMRVMMRSNDIWLGFPYDIVQFAALQAAVASDMHVPMGSYTHTVGSLHLYESDIEAAKQVTVSSEQPVPYQPLWKGSIDIISRARRLLLGYPVSNPTAFEKWLGDTLKPKPRDAT